MNIRNNNYVLTLLLMPFSLIIFILISIEFLKSKFYHYLFIIMFVICIISFIISLFYTVDGIIKSSNKKRLIFLIIFPFFYLPVYYTKYISKNEKVLGYFLCIFLLLLNVTTFFCLKKNILDYSKELDHKNIVLKNKYDYYAKNYLFSIDVNKNYSCNNDLGDYVIACDNSQDDSFLGIYSYKKSDNDIDFDSLYKFHIDQSIGYIEENGYDYNIEYLSDMIKLNYLDNQMSVIISKKYYQNEEDEFLLVIIKEVQNDYQNVIEFEKIIETINFLV